MFLIWMLVIGMSSVGKTDCGHIKLYSSGESKKRTIPSCTQFSQQQTASWLHGEGGGLMENMCLLGAVIGVWGESWWRHGAMESGPGHPGAVCVEQGRAGRWVQAIRKPRCPASAEGQAPFCWNLKALWWIWVPGPGIKWSNLILLSWNVPECVSSDFSCLKSNPLKPKYHF